MNAGKQQIRVAVNGYGVIGKRVADAVSLQDDMRLIGVSDIINDWRPRVALGRGIRLFGAAPEHADGMRKAGLEVAGALPDLLGQVDIVVDGTPKKVAAKNVELYRERNHLHYWAVEMTRAASKEEVLAAFRTSTRIALIRYADGLPALNAVKELMSDAGRLRADLYEVALWEDMLKVQGNELFYAYMVDNQAIVVPETIDAIRALSAVQSDAGASIASTDAALGIGGPFR